ncbi:MAG TPA: tRNA pseudouridine(38-40) synthase TruA [Thermomicrobiales bacterium]|nr:tRNA pseudouridine(38-40) synthase TruA [Thermomicrobiales bacterium]
MLKLTIAYDGTGFQGSQRQKTGRSVQEELEKAFFGLNGQAMRVDLAGRTDSGVHAIGQVASVEDIRPDLDDARMMRAINAHLDDDLAVVACERRESGFHARYDATWREYRYRIWWGGEQPLQRDRVWRIREPLDLGAMQSAATALQGSIDLASFAGLGAGVPGAGSSARGTRRSIRFCTVRAICPWWGITGQAGGGVEIRIVADGFLPHSVRTMTSALVEIGSGRRPIGWLQELIELADRRYGPRTAPPHGLVLWRVGYGHDVPDPGRGGEQTTDEGFIGRSIG